MPRKKNVVEEIDLREAITQYAEAKNFTEEYVEECLKNAIIKAYCKTFLGIVDPSNGIFSVELGSLGKTKIVYGRTVKNPEDITDDFLEIDSDDSDVLAQGLKVGDVFNVTTTIDELKDSTEYSKFNKSWTTTFQSSITTAEKKALMDIYKGKIGDIVTGVVDRYSKDREVWYVMLGKTQAKLEKRDLIGDETFRIGEEIKLYLASVESDSKNGAILKVSRSCPEFLKRIFELEVHEVYEGTVIIKKIAREAGVRSKVAVYTNVPNVDACGACIGMNGGRIQAITQNLGNAREKEKIDVVLYDNNLSLFIAESLVPATVIGVALSNDRKSCIAIVKNNELSLAIGKAGINAKLAARLCNVKIDIKEQDAAFKEGITFQTIEDIRKKAAEEKAALLAAQEAAKVQSTVEAAPSEETAQSETPKETIEAEKSVETPVVETKVVENQPVETSVVEEAKPVAETKPVETVKATEEIKPEEKVDVKVTVSITELERQIEEQKKIEASKASNKKNFKKFKKDDFKKSENKISKDKDDANQTGMAIYTEEELAELEKEETEESYGVDNGNDYEDYDDDSLYDGKK
jgi:N utilization substance protein A